LTYGARLIFLPAAKAQTPSQTELFGERLSEDEDSSSRKEMANFHHKYFHMLLLLLLATCLAILPHPTPKQLLEIIPQFFSVYRLLVMHVV
jgi:hypothetical protein